MTLDDLVHEVAPDLIERDDNEVYMDCPFCTERNETPDTRHRLGINVDTGNWNCFNCGFAGRDNHDRLFGQLVRIFNLDPAEYRFSWRTSRERKEVKKKKALLRPISLPNEFEPLWEKPTDRIHKKALKYMLERGITKKQIEDHFVGFCAVGTYSGRIVFPVYRKESVIGFVTRAFLNDVKPKYLNSDGLKYLWNVPEEKKKRGILLEGVFDALASERALHTVHPMAGLGKDLTDTQLEALLKFKELTIVPDPDKVGLKGVIKRMANLKEAGFRGKLYVILPRSTVDWGKLGESHRGERKIIRAYKGRVIWTKDVRTRLKARAAFL